MDQMSVRIKTAREEKGYTLKQAAEMVGVSEGTFSRYEGGHIGNIPNSRIEKIAEALGVTPGYLMGWEEPDSEQKVELSFPEGFRLIQRASKELSPKDKERLVQIMKAYLDE